MRRPRRAGRPKSAKDADPPLVPPDNRTPLTNDVSAYLEALELRAFSATTVANRRRDLRRFVRWCTDRGIYRANELTKPVLVQYQRHLFHQHKRSGERISVSTQASRLSAVKQLCKWLCKEDKIDANPAADLEMPRTVRQPPRHVLTAAEAELVLSAPDITDPMGLRARAILEVLYSTGIRRTELIGLSIYDVDAGRSCIHIRRGKGGRARTIPIGERALLWVQKYLDEVRPMLVVDAAETTLFLTTNGEPLSKPWLTDVVRGCVKAAGVEKPGACHLFRHTMATLMLENGADIRFIQAMLGHALLATTEIYTHVAIDKLREVHAATHPAKLHPSRHDDDR